MKKVATVSVLALTLFTAACTPVAKEATETTSPSVSTPAVTPLSTASPSAPVLETGQATDSQIAQQLTYLIEEEKLAFDIYSAMYELWGARTFGNILNSEQNHQSQVLTVMSAYDIADPRSSEPGVFTIPALQALYDDLLAQGSKSELDAFKVGVAIEELDIADLTDMLATATGADVIAMMENLRRGSENHLRAFNSKL